MRGELVFKPGGISPTVRLEKFPQSKKKKTPVWNGRAWKMPHDWYLSVTEKNQTFTTTTTCLSPRLAAELRWESPP